MTDTKPTEAPTTVLVIGATGRTGRHVVSGLLERGARVRALVRTPVNAGLPEEVEVVRGDLDDPASVSRAAEGAQAAFLLWHRFSADGAKEVVTALAEHCDHITYLSASDLRAEDGDRPVDGVWASIEALIEQAPVTHTFVRGGGFAGNTLEWAEQIRSGDTVRMPFAEAGRSLVDERDLAAVSVRGLLDPDMVGASPSVTGPEVLTQRMQVETIGRVLGRTLRVEERPIEEVRREYAQALGSEYADEVLHHWSTLVENPEPARGDVHELIGRPPHTYAEWVELHADDFQGPSADEQLASPSDDIA